jgi:hypothetical protein
MESSKMKGAYLHPINPTIWQDEVAGCAMFIFTKTELQGLAASLLSACGLQGMYDLPKVKVSPTFPYRNPGGKPELVWSYELRMLTSAEDGSACFAGEFPNSERPISDIHGNLCPLCNISLDFNKPSGMLVHMGAHTFYDG